MPCSNAPSRWLTATFALASLVCTAQAQDVPDPEEESLGGLAKAMSDFDETFGTYVVGPIGSVLFFDLNVFDNKLSDESMYEPIYGNPKLDAVLLGATMRGEADPFSVTVARAVGRRDSTQTAPVTESTPLFRRATGVDGAGLVQMSDYTIVNSDEFMPVLDTPVPRTVDGVELLVSTRDGQLLGTATGGQVDLAALGIDLGEAQLMAADGSEVLLAVEDPALPGMTLSVTSTGEVRGGQGPVPRDVVPVVAGMTVSNGDMAGTLVHISETGRGLLQSAGEPLETTYTKNPRDLQVPLVVAWLVLGALFFTLRMTFVNLRMFTHAIAVTAGRYDNDDDPGEISHFQALASALSATVGLGNISGVAIAVSLGGPGAVFWMVIAGALGMSSKFVECTLGQMYRKVDSKGVVSGGPMHYLSRGLVDLGERTFGSGGKVGGGLIGYPLAALFAVMCIGGSFGGGNMFQANQSFAALSDVITTLAPSLDTPNTVFYMSLVYGLMLAGLVGAVILGGIKRIGVAAGVIVPLMCGIYLMAGIAVLAINYEYVPDALGQIVRGAFTPAAGVGGVMGALMIGFKRAAFSNEAGVGSASIAHSAASTPEPVREGIVSLLEPFIDTIVVCTMTGLVVVVTGAYLQDTGDGVLMTSSAFASVFWWFPYVRTFAVVLFAFSTMISWSYYGERASVWLFGEWSRLPYKAMFMVFVVFGSVFKLGNVLEFSDLMVLGMALPNILGAVLLSGHVKRALDSYIQKLRAGSFDTKSAPSVS